MFRPGAFEYHKGLRLTDILSSFDELRPSGKAVVLLSSIRQLPYIRDPGGETGTTVARLDGMLDVTLSLPVTEQGPLLVDLVSSLHSDSLLFSWQKKPPRSL